MRIRLYAYARDYTDTLDVVLFAEDRDGRRYAGKPVQFSEEPHDSMIFTPEPTFQIRGGRESFRQVMDELWRSGVRPTDYESNDKMSATISHLKDMRTIVFDHFLPTTNPRTNKP